MSSKTSLFILWLVCVIEIHCEIFDVWNPSAFQDLFFKRSKISSASTVKEDNVYDSNVVDVDLNTLQIINRHGYNAESHMVTTEDGYILTIHRIPCNVSLSPRKKCQPVFLQHGLLASSADFVVNGPKKALPYILANIGYDVWLGNFRGNTYSRAHVSLAIHDPLFWDFSWHEIAMYDLPAMIDYVNNYKDVKNEIIYIGHSMGTTTLFALLSTKTEYNYKLKAAFTFAPVAYMKTLKSPIRYLAPFSNSLEWITKHLGLNEFLPENIIIKWLGKDCNDSGLNQALCENIMFVLSGFDKAQMDPNNLPVIIAHTPAGASTKSIIHYAQEIKNSGMFQMYDYGTERNLQKYGRPTPPPYNLTNISLPIGFFCGENDLLSAIPDAHETYEKLLNPIEFYKIPYKNFNHLDFLWAKDAPTLVYKKLLLLMKKFN